MLLVDAGFLIALLDKKDAHHRKASQWSTSYREGWITSWPVLAEATHILTNRVHIDCALAVLDDVASGVLQVWNIPESAVADAQKLMRKYKKLPMDLADASLVLLAEHLNTGRILTTDQRDFGSYRWKSRQPFDDVMQIM